MLETHSTRGIRQGMTVSYTYSLEQEVKQLKEKLESYDGFKELAIFQVEHLKQKLEKIEGFAQTLGTSITAEKLKEILEKK